jgi:hypothetical protein
MMSLPVPQERDEPVPRLRVGFTGREGSPQGKYRDVCRAGTELNEFSIYFSVLETISTFLDASQVTHIIILRLPHHRACVRIFLKLFDMTFEAPAAI